MARLRRSDANAPGIRRVRSGRGFRYLDPDGAPVTPELRERIEALVIPPAWTDVWIAPTRTGTSRPPDSTDSAAGSTSTTRRGASRRTASSSIACSPSPESLPAARRGVTIDLRRDDLSARARARGRVPDARHRQPARRLRAVRPRARLASACRRCWRPRVRDRRRHGRADASPRKSGQEWESDVRDPDLAALVARLKRRGPRARLLAWRDDAGVHPLSRRRDQRRRPRSAPAATSRRRTSAPCTAPSPPRRPRPDRAEGLPPPGGTARSPPPSATTAAAARQHPRGRARRATSIRACSTSTATASRSTRRARLRGVGAARPAVRLSGSLDPSWITRCAPASPCSRCCCSRPRPASSTRSRTSASTASSPAT